ncbi:hypothetical protein SRABI26_03699 [Arthrobacter sp. Bi26]|uniref:hypothetical protein n=1 Tax=Arthrobacter sp. Bi26 TaxID=2822350 RepID=UPI001D53C9E8|nr:hypothetical protein [Arthrobacter sp. Bi26]CAH0272322.1 hypothetical protein SRABI26_03699 [Arthrobacter sp. Bi26]
MEHILKWTDPGADQRRLFYYMEGCQLNSYCWAWAISGVVLVVLTIVLGLCTEAKSVLGILVDGRGRTSLTHFQLTMWTVCVLSLISGVFWGRLLSGVDRPLEFDIPTEVIGLMGIAVGSAVATTIAKSAKDNDPEACARIAVPRDGEKPKLAQIFLLEEGTAADEVIDITKFQNFVITVFLGAAYTAVAVHAMGMANPNVESLPGLDAQLLSLLGISHAGYVAGKMPKRSGAPDGHKTLADRIEREQSGSATTSTTTGGKDATG